MIEIRKIGVTKAGTDCIVNAANSALAAGGGVAGAIFREAGYDELQQACRKIGGCKEGSAVITPAFKLNAKYIIHAVGPVWNGGRSGEPEQLSSCYRRSLELMLENNCRSITFPLISSGIFGYPLRGAWEQALTACTGFLAEHSREDISVTFALLGPDAEERKELGEEILRGLSR